MPIKRSAPVAVGLRMAVRAAEEHLGGRYDCSL